MATTPWKIHPFCSTVIQIVFEATAERGVEWVGGWMAAQWWTAQSRGESRVGHLPAGALGQVT